jgi:UDP-N-acetylglucosamine 1-carboxyvinyltransferase
MELNNTFVVKQTLKLSGQVKNQGAKNSALKLLAATLLKPGVHYFDNVPRITDIDDMLSILADLGVAYERYEHELKISVPKEINHEISSSAVSKIRASVVLLGPVLVRAGKVIMAKPGGDNFGERPIDMHLKAFRLMGALDIETNDSIEIKSARGLKGADIHLDYPSHTATDNIIMAACLSDGVTLIDNAAREPEVIDLCNYLIELGADISGAGTSTIRINGVRELSNKVDSHRVIADRVEAAAFLIAAAICHGEVEVIGAEISHLNMLLNKLNEIGVETKKTDCGVVAINGSRVRAADIQTLPYPGIATDYKPALVALLSYGEGTSIVSDNVFGTGRFAYLEELMKMGADISTKGHHVIIKGQERLTGARVRATDVRAGSALVLAALGAEGTTIIEGTEHINRGYEDFGYKLASLGADISWS